MGRLAGVGAHPGAGFHVVPMDVRELPQDVERDRRGTTTGPGPVPRTPPTHSERLLAVVSPAFLNSRRAAVLGRRRTCRWAQARRHRLVPVRVGDVRLSLPHSGRGAVDLIRLDEERAHHRAADRASTTRTACPRRPTSPRAFPGTGTQDLERPPRNPWFTGRSPSWTGCATSWAAARSGQRLPQVLYGLGGVGKTQVAREYAHRFMADYDLVWWIDSEQGNRGPHDQAEHWERRAVEGLRRRFGADHPDVLVGMGNLAITLRDTRREEAGQLQERAVTRLTQLLGRAHPVTTLVRSWRRVGRDLEPHQI